MSNLATCNHLRPSAAPTVAAAGSAVVDVAICNAGSLGSSALPPWCAALAAEGLSVEAGTVHGQARAALLCVGGALGPALPLLRELREQWPLLPLVVLCATLRDVDQVLALEMGADEVLADDTAPVVLAARLRALWRWQRRLLAAPLEPAGAPRLLRFGGLAIDREQRVATLAGRPLALTEGEFEVLWLLAAHSGEPLSRREMLQRLRGLDPTRADDALDGDRSIDSRVYRLRGKLGDRSRAAPGIRTVRHRGYLFAPAAW
jgi:two-component system response regulator RstA